MFTLPDLSYPYNALEPFIDEATMRLHHDKHHAAYVKNLNDLLANYPNLSNMGVEDLIRNLDKAPSEIRAKIRNNGGQHYNHSFFWTVMAPQSGYEPKRELLEKINTSFESFTNFKDQFAKSAIGLFGSGWVWLVIDKEKLAITTTPNGDSPLMNNSLPILGLDIWEHAYYLKYQNRRAEYVEAWWSVVNWKAVEKNYLNSIK